MKTNLYIDKIKACACHLIFEALVSNRNERINVVSSSRGTWLFNCLTSAKH